MGSHYIPVGKIKINKGELSCKKYKVVVSETAEIKYDSCDCENSEKTITILPALSCGLQSAFSGNVGYPVSQSYNLGNKKGEVTLSFNTFSVPDRFLVYYKNKRVIDTGYRGAANYGYGEANRNSFTSALTGKTDPVTGLAYPLDINITGIEPDGYPEIVGTGAGTATFTKNSENPNVEIRVYAPMSGTAWNLTLGCPDGDEEPEDGEAYTIIYATSTPEILSGEATIECLGIAVGDDGDDGIDGDSSYVYIAYASDDAGTDFTTTFDPALDYIAILATDTEIPSPAVGDFAGLWKKYKGEPGEDASSDVQDLTGKSKYGALYNWYAATDERNICNIGWHIPDMSEFAVLYNYLGGSAVAGGKLKEVGLVYWNSPNTEATNETGFNGRAAGVRDINPYPNFYFFNLKYSNELWSSDWTDYGSYEVGDGVDLNYTDGRMDRTSSFKQAGRSIRLVKNSTTLSHGETGTYTGNDGKVYKTICIGTQEWLAENLAETRFRTGERISFHGATYEDKYTNAEWAALTTEAMCWYNDDETNGWEPGTLTETIETIFKNLDGKEHNSLEGLQGGDAEEGEFYHLTAAEKELVEGLSADDKKEWQTFEYRNIDAGTADTFVFDVMADVPFTINSIVLEVDNGTLTGIAVKINGVAVTGLSSVTATTTAARTNATAANVVAAGDKITFEITTGYTGAPTKLIGKLSYTRT